MKLGDFEVLYRRTASVPGKVKEAFTVTRDGRKVASGVVKDGCVVYQSECAPGPSRPALAACLAEQGADISLAEASKSTRRRLAEQNGWASFVHTVMVDELAKHDVETETTPAGKVTIKKRKPRKK